MELEEYMEQFSKEVKSRLILDEERLNEKYEKTKEICIAQCRKRIQELLLKCKEEQEKGNKESISCVGVHFLRTSVRTGSYEYKIALYHKELFLDRQEVAVYWEPPYYREVAEAAVKDLTTLLRKECIRVPNYDIKLFCEEYLYRLMKHIPKEVIENLESVYKMEEFVQLNYEEQLEFYKGAYLMKQEPLMEKVCISLGGEV